MNIISIGTFLLFILALPALGQSKSWGISYSPGFSKGKIPSGVSIGYPPPPYYINFKEHRPSYFSNNISIFHRKYGRWLTHTKSIGLAEYHYRDRWTYDTASTLLFYRWGKNDLLMIEGGYKLGYDLKLGKIQLIPEVGLVGNYLIYAYYQYETDDALGGPRYQEGYSTLAKLDRFNYGFTFSLKTRIKLNEKMNIETGPIYKHLVEDYKFPGESNRVLFFYGLSVDMIFIKAPLN